MNQQRFEGGWYLCDAYVLDHEIACEILVDAAFDSASWKFFIVSAGQERKSKLQKSSEK